MAKRKKQFSAGVTQAIGGALVGFDQQIFRGMPRVEERFQRRDEISLAASEGGTLVVGMPDGVAVPESGGDQAPTDPSPASTSG